DNPLKGQELAVNLVRYGPRVGLPLLIFASVAIIGGFALLNKGLYDTVGPTWYDLRSGYYPRPRPEPAAPPQAAKAPPVYTDFLAYALTNLLQVADLLTVAAPYNLRISYIPPNRWPASTLLVIFKFFFTAVLLQQIFASFRQVRLLSQTIQDFWSPHPPIREQ